MKVQITYSTPIDITFDHTYTLPRKYRNFGEAIEMAKFSMKLHNFMTADIVDGMTGEVLAIIENDDPE